MNENNTETAKSSGNVNSMPPQITEPTPEPKPVVGSLDIVINDRTGIPIPDFEYQILVGTRIAGSGRTDSTGNGKTIEGLKIGSTFNIEVKTDKGEFKYVATGKIEKEYCIATLCSEQTRFIFTSVVDKGDPGTAAAHKQKVIAESAKPPTVTTTEHKLKHDKDEKGKPVILVEAAKIKPATAKDIIAALPQVDDKPYAAGIDYKYGKNMDVVPNKLVCNEYVYHAYRIAGEIIPPSMVEQVAYFKRHNRFETDMAKGEVGDVAFFDNPLPLRQHEVIVIKIKIIDDVKWYLVSGARNEDKVSGMLTSAETESHKEEPIYISQDGKPASMRDNKLLPWGKKTTFVRGFKTFVGFGKAGK